MEDIEDSIPPGFVKIEPKRRKLGWKRLVLGLVAAFALGLGLSLQFHGWHTLSVEAGGECGGDSGRPCPKGTTIVLLPSFFLMMAAVPLTFIALALYRRRIWAVALLVAAAVVGVLPGNALYGLAHGHDLDTAWQLPKETDPRLDGEGGWVTGGAVVRARLDQLAAYDVVTGRSLWTWTVPDPQLLCAMSAAPVQSVGLLAYGQEGSSCDTLVALDLTTGRPLWSRHLAGSSLPQGATSGFVAVGAAQAFVAAPASGGGLAAGAQALDLRTGRQEWAVRTSGACIPTGLGTPASTGLLVTVECIGLDGAHTYEIRQYDGNGRQQWRLPLAYQGQRANVTVLSYAPLLVSVEETGTRGADTLYAIDSSGHVTARIDESAERLILGGSGFDAQPAYHLAVAGGVLVVGRDDQRLTGYRLSDGSRLWDAETGDLQALTTDGDRVVALTEQDFRESLTGYDPADGGKHGLGGSSLDLLTAQTAVHVVGGRYVIVVANATSYPPIAVLR